jgi:cytochrome b561
MTCTVRSASCFCRSCSPGWLIASRIRRRRCRPTSRPCSAGRLHYALYALLIVQPIVGWIATSAYRAPILVFWTFTLPPIWPEDRAFSERMFVVHKALGIAIAVLALMHIAAALYHHFVRRDATLMRMLRG